MKQISFEWTCLTILQRFEIDNTVLHGSIHKIGKGRFGQSFLQSSFAS